MGFEELGGFFLKPFFTAFSGSTIAPLIFPRLAENEVTEEASSFLDWILPVWTASPGEKQAKRWKKKKSKTKISEADDLWGFLIF